MTHAMFSQDEVDAYDVLKDKRIVFRNTSIGRISINLDSGSIRLVQRWKYRFTLDQTGGAHGQKADAWTDDEQRDFHFAARSIIWKFWNSRQPLPQSSDPTEQAFVDLLNAHAGISFSVSGSSDFAQRFAGRQLPIEFDILIANKKPAHFVVIVKKMLPGRNFRPFVDENLRHINLAKTHNERVKVGQDGRNGATNDDFYYTPHEFGHALGYGVDEYEIGAVNRKDVESLMNIGKEVRPRHLKAVATQLSFMIPKTRFNLPKG